MELQYRLLACYLLAINVATLITFGIDKLKAKRAKWRIPEATLLMMAAVGGSVGAWAGMSYGTIRRATRSSNMASPPSSPCKSHWRGICGWHEGADLMGTRKVFKNCSN